MAGLNSKTITKKEAMEDLTKPKPKIKKQEGGRNEKGGLLGLILLMFGGREIYTTDVFQLNPDERVILQSIIKRKFNIEIDSKWETDKIAEIINRDKNNSKSKRLEENYKLVFKKALKFLLIQFKKTNKLRCRKNELEKLFFDHYFKKVCQENGETMESFLFTNKDNKKATQN